MKIWFIWATDGYGHYWLVDAWDDDTVAENHDGWVKAVEDARNDHGTHRVSVVSGDVDMSAVITTFQGPSIGKVENLTPAAD